MKVITYMIQIINLILQAVLPVKKLMPKEEIKMRIYMIQTDPVILQAVLYSLRKQILFSSPQNSPFSFKFTIKDQFWLRIYIIKHIALYYILASIFKIFILLLKYLICAESKASDLYLAPHKGSSPYGKGKCALQSFLARSHLLKILLTQYLHIQETENYPS